MADHAFVITAANAPALRRELPTGAQLPQIAGSRVPDRPANDDHPQLPERLAPDLPPVVGFMLISPFVWIIGAYLITFWGDLQALEMVVVDIVYVAVYLGVPWIILKLEPKRGPNPTFAEFLDHGISTFTGHLRGREALLQILLIPVALAVATTGMCLVAVLA